MRPLIEAGELRDQPVAGRRVGLGGNHNGQRSREEGHQHEAKHEPARLTEDHSWVDHLLEWVTLVSCNHGRLRFLLDFKGDEATM